MEGAWWVNADELDPDQKGLIQIPRDGRYLVLGPPGSGKTNVLILRAAYLYRSGLRNILVVTFTRALKEFIEAGVHDRYHLPRTLFTTFASWSQAFVHHAGASLSLSEDEGDSFDHARMHRIRELQGAISRGQYTDEHYDAILIDEAQDFWRDEIEVLGRLTKRIFAVGDNRQRIYSRNEGIEALRAAGCIESRLDFHYRVGRNICRVADKVLRSARDPLLIESSAYPETTTRSVVEVLQCASLAEQTEEVIRRLAVQLRAYPNEGIGVLCPKRVLRDSMWHAIECSALAPASLLQSADAGYQEFDAVHPICVLDITRQKGWSSERCIFWLGRSA